MEVLLKITSYHRLSPEIEATKSTEDSLTFGRARECDWHLPDPEKVISNKHGEVVNEGGLFYVYDYSTNGLFINHSVSPLGKGNKHKLVDGDTFNVGDFQIEASLQGAQQDLSEAGQPNVPAESPAQTESAVNSFSSFDAVPAIEPAPAYAREDILDESMIPPKMAPADTADSVDNTSSNVNFIPEDWDAFSFSDNTSLDPFANDHQMAPQPQPQPQPQPSFVPPKESATSPTAQAPEVQPQKEASKERGQTTTTPIRHELPQNSNQQAHMQAFLEGLGVSSAVRDELETEKQWFEMGVGLNALLMGVINSLRQRANMKNQMKINRTMFQVEQNNPLKFSATIDDAIQNLYTRKSGSFLGATASIKESFDDLHTHEGAILAAASGSLEALLKLLSPEMISKKADENNSLLKFMPKSSGAISWKLYQELFEEYSKEVNQKGVMALSDEFLSAYDNYVNKQN
ncbi:FHA domain protein [Marinomonas spartinae]|uniref:type VI secretion system-associated FHA domain protein TagH n=1 Tax=Marinomonas spartinae TaxID=1792290 RepID=UPI000808A454|nr:type VI secretion system-associated FHA domain protein TagH [Marinomonas spartinae]SBS38275.1 FHA domain protein [Marinomonas spartinae]